MASVLIVEDGVVTRTSTRGILQSSGFDVVGEAENGKIAIEKYKQLKPDVVVMDIMMPVMDGIQATKEIIKSDPDARIIILTARDELDLVRQISAAGAKDFVVKPFHASRLIEGIYKVLNEKKSK
jgi:two-component system chemotaxis response regulator CheY